MMTSLMLMKKMKRSPVMIVIEQDVIRSYTTCCSVTQIEIGLGLLSSSVAVGLRCTTWLLPLDQ